MEGLDKKKLFLFFLKADEKMEEKKEIMPPKENPSCFVATIDVSLAEKLQADLTDQGFTLTKPPHTYFAAVKKGVSCTLYLSGKITVQGKDKGEFLSFYLEPQILQNLSYSYPHAQLDLTERIGLDEAGKGDFFGPLCIAGCCAKEEQIKALISFGVKDSKKMSDKSVLDISYKIKKECPHKILRLFPETYNNLYEKFHNLNRMLAWAHSTVLEDLVKETHCSKAILDQFAPAQLMEQMLERKKIPVQLVQRFRGEEDVVVAAASILARAAFLEGLQTLGNSMQIELPKGASSLVIEKGKKIVAIHGEDALKKLGKLHFKTKDSILHD